MSLFNELKRRNVIRVAIAYLIIGWLLAQVSTTLEDALNLPPWFDTLIVTVMLIGFPIAIIIAWVYELTPEGIKKEKDITRDDSITNVTAKKLNYITIFAALSVVGIFVWQQMSPKDMDSRVRENDKVTVEQVPVIPAQAGTSTSIPENPSITQTKNNSIAVLPFAHRSELKNDLYFTDGIHDDLLTQLAKIQKLNVTSRTSVMQYRDTSKSIKEIAQELNVGTILEGGVQRAGKRIRINAQLIDVVTDEHLWAETFDREMSVDNLFDIQSEITKHIITAIKGQLTVEDENILAKAPTQSVQAYEYYLQAKNILSQGFNKKSFKDAEGFIKKAIQTDPDFGLAYLILADIYGYSFWFKYDLTEDTKQQTLQLVNKAETLLPENSAELLAAQGEFLYRFEDDYSAAINKMLKSAAIIPRDARLKERIANTQRRLGLYEEAIESYRQSIELSPNNLRSHISMAQTLDFIQEWQKLDVFLTDALIRFPDADGLLSYAALLPVNEMGNLDKSIELYEKIPPSTNLFYLLSSLKIIWKQRDYQKLLNYLHSKPAQNSLFLQVNGILEFNIARAHKEFGQEQEANIAFKQLIARLEKEKSEDNPVTTRALIEQNLALSYAYVGDKVTSTRIINNAINTIGDKFLKQILIFSKCWILAYNGETDKALSLLEEYLKKQQDLNRWGLYLNPEWDFMRKNERFNQLIKPINFDESMHANKENKSQ